MRALVSFLTTNAAADSDLKIGALPRDTIGRFKTGREAQATSLLDGEWLDQEQVHQAAAFDTTLRRMRLDAFDLLARHGYETAKWNVELFWSV